MVRSHRIQQSDYKMLQEGTVVEYALLTFCMDEHYAKGQGPSTSNLLVWRPTVWSPYAQGKGERLKEKVVSIFTYIKVLNVCNFKFPLS
jgi:hypothetical protein